MFSFDGLQGEAINYYGKGVHLAKKYLSSQNLDRIEHFVPQFFSAALILATSSCLMRRGIVRTSVQIASALGGVFAGSHAYHRFLKAPFIEKEIQGIVARSKGNERRALMIHTTHDHNGAFKNFHSTAAVYERCAKNHSIDRIRGLTFEERSKVQGEENKYDVVGVLAHGSPQEVNMDNDRMGFNIYRSKYLNFLKLRINDDGVIFLDACQAASGEESLAQVISKQAPKATVYGSSANIHAIVGAEYTDDMVPRYNDGTLIQGKNTTRAFRGGEESEIS